MKQFQPASKLLIRDLEALRVIADPLRSQIINLLVAEPLTVRQVAEKLRVTPSKLYYHFSLLEKHGFIQVVETHLVANILEKTYRANAVRYELDRSLLAFVPVKGNENVDAAVATILDATRERLSRSLAIGMELKERGEFTDRNRALLANESARIPVNRVSEFIQRFTDLIDEFGGTDVSGIDEDDLQSYAVTLAFFPIIPGDEEQEVLLEQEKRLEI